MMAKIVQHIPTSVERMGEPAPRVEFETYEELIEIDFVKEYMGNPPWRNLRIFHRFSLGENGKKLMAEYNEGRNWWVVGYLSKDHGLDLPEWKPKKKE